MVRLFKSTSALALMGIVILALLLKLPLLLWGEHTLFSFSAPLGYDFLKVVNTWPMWVSEVLAIIILISQSLYFNSIIRNQNVLYKSSYLPALFYIIICSLYPSVNQLSPLLIANTFVLVLLAKMYQLYDSERGILPLLDSGMLLGIAALFHAETILLFPFILVSNITVRPFRLKDLAVPFLGMIVPIYLCGVGYYASGYWETYKNIYLQNFITSNFSATEPNILLAIPLVLIAPLLVIALFRLQTNFFRNNVKTRKAQQISFYLLVNVLAVVAVSRPNFIFGFTLLAIPGGLFLAYHFLSAKRHRLQEFLLWVLLGSVFYLQIALLFV